MSKEYSNIVKGKLSFKGNHKSDKVLKRKRDDIPVDNNIHDIGSSKLLDANSSNFTVEEKIGTGRFTSSDTTIHGHGTVFMTELSPGDAIIITHPSTLQEETKIVRMVLSNVSMGISSAFTTDLISTTAFRYVKAPKDKVNTELQIQKDRSKKNHIEEEAFGTYASQGGEKIVYRVKKSGPGGYGGYKIITENSSKALTREELLQLRTTKKSDRFCY